LTIHIERETDTNRIERWDHEGTTEPLNGLTTVPVCTECGKTCPTRFGAGAPTTRIVSTAEHEANALVDRIHDASLRPRPHEGSLVYRSGTGRRFGRECRD